MAQKARFKEENLTNHSERRRIIQKLNDQEVPPYPHHVNIWPLKNVPSLNNYNSLLQKQQRNSSNTLSSTTSIRRSLAIEEREDVSLSENQESPQKVLSLRRGANIHGGTFKSH